MAYNKGDVVRVGKGKVEYTVYLDQWDSRVSIQSHNTGKFTEVDADRLVLVQAAQHVAEQAGASVEELVIPFPVETEADRDFWETAEEGIDFVPADDEDEPLRGTVVATVPERSAYSKAILAGLQAKAGHVFEGLSLTPRARAKRKAARRASKMNRKVNR